jgi:hypothetical protein
MYLTIIYFLAQGAMKWVVEKKHDLVLLLLDFERAFDQIEHRFLFKALEKLLDLITSGLNGPSLFMGWAPQHERTNAGPRSSNLPLSLFCKTYGAKINLGKIQQQFGLLTTQELGFRVKKKEYIGCLKEKRGK